MDIDLTGIVTTALTPAADMIAAIAPGVAWAWAVVLGGVAFRLLQLPLLVAGIDRGTDDDDGVHPGVRAGVVGTQLFFIVAVYVWAGDPLSPASENGFHTVDSLAQRAIAGGVIGVLAAVTTVTVTTLHTLERQPGMDERQRWFFTRVAPLILLAVTLAMPVAVLLFWAASSVVPLVVHRVVTSAGNERTPVPEHS